jgi:uncharacterized protein
MFKKIFIISCFLVPCLTFAKPICDSEEHCLTLAKQNIVEAQTELGELYYSSKKGVIEEYQKALGWFEKAAAAGNAKAQYYLGLMHYEGKGVKTDYNKAVEWFTKSAAAGNEKAQYYLGVCYYYGKGVAKDSMVAKEWFTKAYNKGYEQAKHYLELLK